VALRTSPSGSPSTNKRSARPNKWVGPSVPRRTPVQIGHRGESEVEFVDDARVSALEEGAEVIDLT
jgi:hypothetical protein